MSNWFILAKRADFQKIAETFRISPVLARLIRNRDVCGEEAVRKYLCGTYKDLYEPTLLKDVEKAADIIRRAIAEQKKIRIIGDYDVDGICSTHILLQAVRALGGNADFAIPHRIRDGYGLNDHLIREASGADVSLIVTCDNGIAAGEQIRLAHELGMQVVVTDHHEVSEVPPAEAVVNPKQPGETCPFPGICGAVVAYKLAQVLGVSEELLEKLLEPAALATVCDVMELQEENRILVKEGIKRMRRSAYPGLRALMEVNGLKQEKLSAWHLGFVLGPCLNASGRLESAALSLELLEETEYKKAVRTAAQLKQLNDSRKEMTEQSIRQAQKLLEETAQENLEIGKRDFSRASLTDKVLVLYLQDCHESLAGIVAGRIREKYHKPTLVLTESEEGVKGSGRSIEGYDMFAELSACKDLFDKFGGHKMAAGVSLPEKNVRELRRRLNEGCRLTKEDFVPKVHIDIALPLSRATEELVEELELLEPFGNGNRKPVFAWKEVPVLSGRILGKNRNVVKLTALDDRGAEREMIYFGDAEELQKFLEERFGEAGKNLFYGRKAYLPLTIAYYPEINEFQGRRTVQLVMTDYC